MELVVESARVADRFATAIAPPQRGRGGPAVGADGALSSRRVLHFGRTETFEVRLTLISTVRVTHHSPFGLDQRPVGPVHLVVEPAGVAEVVSIAVPAPQWSRAGAAVDALPSF